MDASGQLWDRKQHRIDYFGDVRLLSPSDADSVVARAENLSEAGVFVTTSQDAEVGAEVLCELPLALDQHVTLRGRVAWVRPATPRGLGIEFVEVSDEAARALRSAIGPPREAAVRVKVRFEGMPEPVRAEALPTETGICLRTALPFLRLNSPVEFVFTDDDGVAQQQGWLQDVTLQADWDTPVPRLQVKVAQEQPERAPRLEPAEADASQLVDAQRVEDPHLDDPQPASPQPAQQHPDEQIAAARELPSVLVDEEMIVDDEQEAPVPLVRIKGRPTLRNSALTEQLLPACADQDFAAGAVDPCERSYWDFDGVPRDESETHDGELPGMNPEEEDLQFWQRSSPPRRRVGLWVAALSMLVFALASAHVTGFFGLAGAKVSRWIDGAWALVAGDEPAATVRESSPGEAAVAKAAPQTAPPAVAAAKPAAPEAAASKEIAAKEKEIAVKEATAKAIAAQAVAQAAAAKAVAKTLESKEVASKEVASKEVASKEVASKEVASKEVAAPAKKPRAGRALQLKVKGAVTRLRLPITGSLRGKRSYPLANPDGLVVRLPNARSAGRYGSYKLHDGALRVLWIKRHERGVRFRVLYRRPRPACKLAITRDAVLVRCREASKLASR